MTEFVYWYIRRPAQRLRLKFIWMLPRWLVYWCAIRLFANATTGPYGNEEAPAVTVGDALKRWELE